MESTLLAALVDDAVSRLTGKEQSVFRILASSPGIPVSGEMIGQRVWPDKEWERTRNVLQVTVHSIRGKLAKDVIETIDSDYRLVVRSLEKALFQLQFSQPAPTSRAITNIVAPTLNMAGQNPTLASIFLWGPMCLFDLLLVVPSLWQAISDPRTCEIRLAVPFSEWKTVAELISQLETTSMCSTEELLAKCADQFSVFLTGPLFGSGQIVIHHGEPKFLAELFTSEKKSLALDSVTAALFLRDITHRWDTSVGPDDRPLVTCDKRDADAMRTKAKIDPLFAALMTNPLPKHVSLTGGAHEDD